MRMDLLEEELKRIGKGNKRLKMLYTIPNFQNPGGVTMTGERRKRLIELSHEYDFMIIEDDPYGRLRYEGGPAEGAGRSRHLSGHHLEDLRAGPSHRLDLCAC